MCKQRSFYYIFNNNTLTYHNKIVGSALALVILSPYLHGGVYSQKKAGCGRATLASDWRVVSTSLNYQIIMLINMNRSLQFGTGLKLSVSAV